VAAVAVSGCQWDETRFFNFRVVNDSQRAVKVQPCWDFYCLDTKKMPVTPLQPGASHNEDSWWPNDTGDKVTVIILGPHGKHAACLVTSFFAGERTKTIPVSQAVPCPRPPAGGPAVGP
jgi:hypothetical protein